MVFLSGRGIPDPPDGLVDQLPKGAVLFGSSGSSGVEKWVVHTRETLLASADSVNSHLQVTEEDVFGLVLPFYHVGGFGVVARAYQAKAGLETFCHKWDVVEVVELLAERRVTVASMVPTQVYDLVNAGMLCPAGLRVVIVGGGTLEDEIGQRARELGWPVLQSYGMSEAGSQVATAVLKSLEGDFSNKNLDVLPIWEVTEDGRSLVLSGKALCKGILTRDGFESFCKYKTQDQIRIQDGRLSFIGRVDRTVKVKGELVNIDAIEREVSEQLRLEFVLIAVEDEREGYALYGFTEKVVEGNLNELLPPYARLRSHRVIEAFPRSALGKLDRRGLMHFLRD